MARRISHTSITPTIRYRTVSLAKKFAQHDFRDTLKERWAELPPIDKGDFMARKLSTILPAPTLAQRGIKTVPIPEDVEKELSELYVYLRENPRERGLAEFDTLDEKNEFTAQAKFWAHTNEVRFRVTKPSVEIPETAMQFMLAPPLTDEEIAANRERQEARKVKEAAKAAPAGKK